MTAYEQLKQAIMEGELQPGEPLVEVALADWCKVSRTPVREALMRLEQDGLVQRGHRDVGNRRLIVRESSPEEILDIYDTRIVLEGRVAAVAAERRTSHELLSMRRAEERYRLEAQDPREMAESNRAFHRTIWRASRNESLIDLLERLNLHLGRYAATTLAVPGRHATSQDEHEQLVEAIESRDAELATKVASHHFAAARDIRLSIWDAD